MCMTTHHAVALAPVRETLPRASGCTRLLPPCALVDATHNAFVDIIITKKRALTFRVGGATHSWVHIQEPHTPNHSSS